jgi:hypothetical protein
MVRCVIPVLEHCGAAEQAAFDLEGFAALRLRNGDSLDRSGWGGSQPGQQL